mmetsp:Transcript_5347/g.10982  ORF Transcript_5347/g.10982 Transcript_5347/m.10982 type:complete len:200 (+) Transcript_5347:504-1103(+)
MAGRYSSGESTLHFMSTLASLSFRASACSPVAAVRPSGLTDVMPSMGSAPKEVTATKSKLWVFSPSPFFSKKLSRYPFCKNTRSFLRPSGHSSTMACSESFRVAMNTGPAPLASTTSPLFSSLSSGPALSISMLPMRPPPITVTHEVAVVAAPPRPSNQAVREVPFVAALDPRGRGKRFSARTRERARRIAAEGAHPWL